MISSDEGRLRLTCFRGGASHSNLGENYAPLAAINLRFCFSCNSAFSIDVSADSTLTEHKPESNCTESCQVTNVYPKVVAGDRPVGRLSKNVK
jgi:hypothetical protein